MEEIDKKLEKIHKEYEKLWKEEGGEGGYFFDLWKKLGDNFATNLKRFFFKKEVLNPYKEKNQNRFVIEEGITKYLKDKMGMWNLRSIYEDKDSVSAHLVDLAHIPKNHQDWWQDHLIKEKE